MSPNKPGDRLFKKWLIKEVKKKGGQRRCHLSGLASRSFSGYYPKGHTMTAVTPNAPI